MFSVLMHIVAARTFTGTPLFDEPMSRNSFPLFPTLLSTPCPFILYFRDVRCTDVMTRSTELALGALAAAFAQLFTIPVSVIATRQQLANTSTTFLSTLRDILADDGITGLWRGLKPSLVLTINPAITYGMFERLKTGLLKEGEKMTPGKAFVLGALSKTMATVVRIVSYRSASYIAE